MKYALVVDDEFINRQIVREVLESLGYNVQEASDGQQAVDCFQQQEIKFDLITMDFNMPNKNGVQAIREIREINQTTPIIGITAAASIMRLELKQEKNIKILEKPLDSAELKLVLDEFAIEIKL